MSAATMIKPAREAGGTAGAAWDPVASCQDGPEAALDPGRLDQPQRWRRPRRVFLEADLFGPAVSDEYIARVWQVMASCPRHTFLILTGQPGRMRHWLSRCARWDGFITHNGEPVSSSGGGGLIVGYPDAPPQRPGRDRGPRGGKPRCQPAPLAWGWPVPNVWLGVRAPDQARADIGIPALLGVPAAIRFLFCDPLTGPLCLEICDWTPPGMEGFPGTLNPLTGEWQPTAGDVAEEYEHRITGLPRIDWVIAGGEPGPKARPLHPAWARAIRHQCDYAQVPFFFRQWGEWAPQNAATWPYGDGGRNPHRYCWVSPDGGEAKPFAEFTASDDQRWALMKRVGTKAAGRELDGQICDEFPRGPANGGLPRRPGPSPKLSPPRTIGS
jgi:protein gp37